MMIFNSFTRYFKNKELSSNNFKLHLATKEFIKDLEMKGQSIENLTYEEIGREIKKIYDKK